MSTALHRAFGLLIESALPLPELARAADGVPDAFIDVARVPDVAPEGTIRIGPFLWASATRFRVDVPDIARFLVEGGRRIVVDPAPGAHPDSVRVFLLGTALGVLLAQRGSLTMHGNAVRVGAGCVVCVGSSGAGKSTLAAGFHARGFQPLCDDLVAVDSAGRVAAGVPRIKLWAHTAARLGIDTRPLERIRTNLDKFSYPVGFPAAAPLPILGIYVLSVNGEEPVTLTRTAGFAKLGDLLANTYRPRFTTAMGLRQRNTAMCARIAGDTIMARLARPALGFSLDELIDAILTDVAARV